MKKIILQLSVISLFLVQSLNGIGQITPGSLLASNADNVVLSNWLGGSVSGTLLYRRSVNGANSTTFHSLCDNQGPTITLFKTINNTVFGGYNPNSWSSSAGYLAGQTAFLFNLTTAQKAASSGYWGVTNPYSTYNTGSYGPTFGGGHDIWTNSSMTVGYVNTGYSYSALNGTAQGSLAAANALAGPGLTSTSFPANFITEIEVYKITPAVNALNFDGSDDYVAINSPFRAFNKEITVEFWMNAPSANMPFGSVIGQGTSNVDAMTNDVWLMHPNSNGTMTFYVNDAGTWRSAQCNITAGSWHHYAGVANATSTKIYVDGVLIISGPGISNSILSNSGSVIHIGKDVRHDVGRFGNFSIDEVRIWSRALCQAEIVNNKNCEPNAVLQTGLQEYYRFNQGIANGNNAGINTLTDFSGNGRNGALNSFALTGVTSNWVTSGSTNNGTCATFVTPTAPITGTTSICMGASTTLANTNTGGTWTSSNTAVATINASTGAVNSVSAGTSTITYTTDCGGVSTATVTVNTLPSFTACPANQTTGNAAGQCTTVVSYTATATGTPAPTLTYTFSGVTTGSGSGTGSGQTFNVGVTTVTITATNTCGSVNCSFTVTVNDVTAPAITCPASQTVNITPNTCGAVVNYTRPTATDNCSGSAFNFFNAGEPNEAGSEDFLQFYNSGTWNDLNGGNVFVYLVEFNSVINTTFSGYTRLGAFGGHTYYKSTSGQTWQNARNAAIALGGDLASINTLAEDQFLAPYGGSVWVGGYQDHSDPSYVEPGNASQNFGGWKWVDGTKLGAGQIAIVQTGGLASGATFPVGTTTNTFTATDESGNSSACSFTVTVVDNQSPTIVCPANQSVFATSAAGAVVTYTAPVGTDNCPGVTTALIGGLASGSTFPMGVTTVTYRVTDAAGLTATCSFTVTVSGLAPVIVCPSNITVNNMAGQCGANVSFAATETTGIPASTITYTIQPGTFFSVGTTTVTATATNVVGSSTCSFTVTVVDNTLPVIVCPGNQSINLDAACNATMPDYRSLLTASDNCTAEGSLVITQSPAAGTIINGKGAMIVTFTVNDAANNTATCNITLDKKDITAPVINCPAPISVNNSVNVCGATVTFATPTATDNCSGSAFNFFNSGEPNNSGGEDYLQLYNSGTWNDLPDGVGLKAIIEYNIPNAATPAGFNLIGTFGGHTYFVSQNTAMTWTQSRAAAQAVGADLASINTLAESQYLAPYGGNTWVGGYQDHSDPQYVEPGNAAQNFGGWKWVDGTKLGAGQITITQIAGLPSGSVFPIGVTTNTFRATDESGNSSTCSFNVTVTDNQPPSMPCPANITHTSDAGICTYTFTPATPAATDNCPGVTVTGVRSDAQALNAAYPAGTTTITWTATDVNGHSVSCTQTVTVTDNETPVIVCAPNQDLNLDGNCAATLPDYRSLLTATDNCTATGTLVITQSPAAGTAVNATGNITVTFTVTDASGNSNTCSMIVTKKDVTPPTITCPQPIAVNNNSNSCDAIVTYTAPVIFDNCVTASGTQTFNYTGSIVNFTVPAGVTTLNIQALGAQGGSSPNQQGGRGANIKGTIAVTPGQVIKVLVGQAGVFTQSRGSGGGGSFVVSSTNTPLVIAGGGGGVGVNGNSNSIGQDAQLGTSGGSLSTALGGVNGNGGAGGNLGGSGGCGNPGNGGGGLQTNGGGDAPSGGRAFVNGGAGGVDGPANCIVSSTGGFGGGGAGGNGGGGGGGYSGGAGGDNRSNPFYPGGGGGGSFNAGSNQTNTVGNKGNGSVVITWGGNGGNGSVTLTQTAGRPSGSLFPVGITTNTFVATDASGNTATCSFTVTVTDTQKPTITTSGNITRNNDLNDCGANVTVGAPSVGDNCGVQSVANSYNGTSNASGHYPVGTTTVSWTVTDIHGNTQTAVQTITVIDNEKPVIIAPAAIAVNNDPGQCGAVISSLGTATAGDNCVGGTITNNHPSNVYPVGTTTVTWTATDIHGNSATATQTVTVTDNENPTITAPASIAVNNDEGQCGATINIGNATASDNCGTVSVVNNHPSNVYPVGTTIVTWTATDSHSNSVSATQTVVVTDTENPTIVSAADQTQTADQGVCKANVTVVGPATGDNCSVQSVTNSYTGTSNASGVYPVGTTTITWTVTDIHSNTNTSTQTITVTDNEKPTIVSAPDQTQTADAGVCKANVTVVGPTTGDNCSVQSVTNSYTGTSNASGVYPVGTTTITWTVTDIHSNTNTSTQKITVTDNEKPTIVSAADQTQTADAGVCKANVTVVGPATGDNCSVQSVTNSYTGTSNASGVYPVGTTTITWTVTDIHSNTNTSTQTITVTDNEKPTIVSAADQTQTAAAGVCKANVTVVGPATGDNCGVQSVTNSYTGTSNASGVYPAGTTTITWTVTDIHGNTNTSTQKITVTDNEKPTIVSAPDQTQTAAAGVCKANVTVVGPATGDNCGVQSVTNSYTGTSNASGVYPVGTTTITWTVTDTHGNTNTSTQKITVTDNEKPTIVSAADQTQTADAGVCKANVTVAGPATGDNCGVQSVTNSYTGTSNASGVYPVGTTTITWTVTDTHGNTNTSTQKITVTDNEKPKANCKPATVTLVNGAASITAADVNNNSTDNCGIASYAISKSTFNCSNIGANPVTLTVTDIYGNVSTCIATVTVVGEVPSCSIASLPTNTTYTGGVSTNLYLGYGAQSTTLKVTPAANGAPYTYAWSGPVSLLSSNTSGAPVFTPLTSGSYTFTVVTTNKYGCTTSCFITICVTDIRVPGTNGSKVFVCHVPPGNPGNPNTLSISVNAVPAHLGNHTGDRLGSCDQSPCSGTAVNAVTQTVNQSATKEAQVTTTEEEFTVKVAPNPSNTYFTLKFESKYETPLSMRVLDGSGRVIDAKSKIGANSTIQIGHNYSSGTYYAEILQGTQRKVVQLIKGRG